jgi:hypothetical protein
VNTLKTSPFSLSEQSHFLMITDHNLKVWTYRGIPCGHKQRITSLGERTHFPRPQSHKSGRVEHCPRPQRTNSGRVETLSTATEHKNFYGSTSLGERRHLPRPQSKKRFLNFWSVSFLIFKYSQHNQHYSQQMPTRADNANKSDLLLIKTSNTRRSC